MRLAKRIAGRVGWAGVRLAVLLATASPAMAQVRHDETGLPLAGGVAIRRGEEIVAAIGVCGAPGGERDEACARTGLAWIVDRFNR